MAIAGFILGRFLDDFGGQTESRTISGSAPILGQFLNVFGVVCSCNVFLLKTREFSYHAQDVITPNWLYKKSFAQHILPDKLCL